MQNFLMGKRNTITLFLTGKWVDIVWHLKNKVIQKPTMLNNTSRLLLLMLNVVEIVTCFTMYLLTAITMIYSWSVANILRDQMKSQLSV